MFVEACEKAARFTRPAVVSQRDLAGNVTTGVASFVVLNNDGWIITAGHLCFGLLAVQRDQESVRIYDEAVEGAQLEPEFNRRRNLLKRIPRNDSWIRNASIWWGQDGVRAVEDHVYPPADIMICKLDGLDLSSAEFPKFKKPDGLRAGMSLVKIGFPFHEIKGVWDEGTNGFKFDNTGLALFPIDGIFTREIDFVSDNPPDFPVRMVQTSTPGLMGQSGGPTLDAHGTLCAIQTGTQHIPLGFSPSVMVGKTTVSEHQFINVGLGVHSGTLQAILAKHDIEVEWVD
jgi:S1-C subfamily serine protease